MTKADGNTGNDGCGSLPYLVIIAVNRGNPEAMKIIVQQYESHIATLSMRKLRDERNNTCYSIDENVRDRLRSELMRTTFSFRV